MSSAFKLSSSGLLPCSTWRRQHSLETQLGNTWSWRTAHTHVKCATLQLLSSHFIDTNVRLFNDRLTNLSLHIVFVVFVVFLFDSLMNNECWATTTLQGCHHLPVYSNYSSLRQGYILHSAISQTELRQLTRNGNQNRITWPKNHKPKQLIVRLFQINWPNHQLIIIFMICDKSQHIITR